MSSLRPGRHNFTKHTHKATEDICKTGGRIIVRTPNPPQTNNVTTKKMLLVLRDTSSPRLWCLTWRNCFRGIRSLVCFFFSYLAQSFPVRKIVKTCYLKSMKVVSCRLIWILTHVTPNLVLFWGLFISDTNLAFHFSISLKFIAPYCGFVRWWASYYDLKSFESYTRQTKSAFNDFCSGGYVHLILI